MDFFNLEGAGETPKEQKKEKKVRRAKNPRDGKLIMINTTPAEDKKRSRASKEAHQQASELFEEDGKVRWEKLKYDLDQLHEK